MTVGASFQHGACLKRPIDYDDARHRNAEHQCRSFSTPRPASRIKGDSRMIDEKQQDLRLDFGNLPLVEAATRVSFKSPVSLTFDIINAMRDRLGEEFSQISEPKRIEVAPGIDTEIAMGPGHIPGVVYTGGPMGLVLTLQGQMIAMRWLKQIANDAPEYPRFDVLRDALWQAVEALKVTCKADELPIAVVNMSYVNFLAIPDSTEILDKYFSSLVHVDIIKRSDRLHKQEVSWRERDSVDLRFALERVEGRVAENVEDGFRLTTAAGKLLAESDEPRPALDHIHKSMQLLFRELISDHAKHEWQLKEV